MFFIHSEWTVLVPPLPIKKLKIDKYYYELLPEDKVKHIEILIEENKRGKVTFVGDRINDAPVIHKM
ncbi:hypothetical protein L3073_02120 [Ancylomarina sp. DW003]|nr:hypothetical protein [Ancylomarina sp. DW003]MDE5420998.1 hypothetical protein [Ancylomarina sp. DW003]